MPVRVECQDQGSPERLGVRHLRPGQDPYILRDHSSGAGLIIAVVCDDGDKRGEVYHIPTEALDDSSDAGEVPEELLSDGNLHATIQPGKGYERRVIRPGEGPVRFIFKYFG